MVSRIYDQVADQYDEDWSNLYSTARAQCLRQILKHLDYRGQPPQTVDLGIGTGSLINELRQQTALGECTGLDISRGMLEQARRKNGSMVKLIHADAADTLDYLPVRSQDLVLCHFLLSFMDMPSLLTVAKGLLRPGGLLSLATSTQASLSELHSIYFPRASRLVGIQNSLRRASTPRNHRHCMELLESHGFEIVDEHLHRQAVRFESFADVRSWALDSGWAASFLDDPLGFRKLWARLGFALAELLIDSFYPAEATNEISIVLARKPDVVQPR